MWFQMLVWAVGCGTTDEPGLLDDSGVIDNDEDGWAAADDCNDDDPAVHPDAPELCNSADDDCDGEVDEGLFRDFYLDDDGDGFGDADITAEACSPPDGYTETPGDCDDADAAVNPDAIEVCGGIDEDCDGLVDDDDSVSDQATWYQDEDGDTYGTEVTQLACEAELGWASESGDCDDGDPDIFPTADELCDGIDNDCDLGVDDDDPEGPSEGTWESADIDGDGFGGAERFWCAAPVPAQNDWDCDDSDELVNPWAEEVCKDGIDNNCDGDVDDCDPLGELPLGDAASTTYEGTSLESVGWAVAPAGDVDMDGIEDLLIGAATADTYKGEAYLVSGPISGGSIGTATATFEGERKLNLFGESLAGVGDVVGDEYPDIAIAGSLDDAAAFVFAGPVAGYYASEADADFVIQGDTLDSGSSSLGAAMAGAVDFSGDSLDDLVIAAPTWNAPTSTDGAVFVWFGPLTGTVTPDTANITIEPKDAEAQYFGANLLASLDLYGSDGVADLVVGMPHGNDPLTGFTGEGAVHVFDGSDMLANMTDGDAAVSLFGGMNRGLGIRMAAASNASNDHNGDGYDDLIVSEPGWDHAYIVFGPLSSSEDIADADVVIEGGMDHTFGAALDASGDLDRDGALDVAIGAPTYSGAKGDAQGAAFVFMGPLSGTVTHHDAHAVLEGEQSNHYAAQALTMLPDQEGDGFDELVVGVPGYGWSGFWIAPGAAYVVPGSSF